MVTFLHFFLVIICFMFACSQIVTESKSIDDDLSHRAVQILSSEDKNSYVSHIETLKNILDVDDIRDRNVVVISMAGALRQGKSFLLNFYLRYLHAKYKINDVSDWLGENSETPLKGFSWRGGTTPDTQGILMWSEIFTYDYESGEKVAIILLDTQGIFDSESSMRDTSTIFALSTMLSSVQCYNLMRNIQEDNLQHLHLFTEYAKLALERTHEKPFQFLLFIVRDWPFWHEYDYGWKGGQQFVDKQLNGTDKQTHAMKQLRQEIKSSFAKIGGFLMPNPGEVIAEGSKFSGNFSDISSKFREMLKELVPQLLSPEHLIVKKINGREMRARDFIKYYESYVKIFKENKLPEPKTVLEATAEAYSLIAIEEARENYTKSMEMVIANTATYLNESDLQAAHSQAKNVSTNLFQAHPHIGGDKLTQKYFKQLAIEIDGRFENAKVRNEHQKKIYYAKLEINCLSAVKDAVAFYMEYFRKQVDESNSNAKESEIQLIHESVKMEAISKFRSKVNVSENDFLLKFEEQLEEELEKEYSLFKLNYTNEKQSFLDRARMHNKHLIEELLRKYEDCLKIRFLDKGVKMKSSDLEKLHLSQRESLEKEFEERKIDDGDFCKISLQKLLSNIDEKYLSYKQLNNEIKTKDNHCTLRKGLALAGTAGVAAGIGGAVAGPVGALVGLLSGGFFALLGGLTSNCK